MCKEKFTNYLLVSLIVILIVFVSAGFILTNPSLKIKYIELYGAAELYSVEISRILEGCVEENIILFASYRITREIERIPQIKTARVRRILPDKIEIFVLEHEPTLLIKLDKLYGISGERILIPLDETTPIPDLPIITGLSRLIQPEPYTNIHSLTLDEVIRFVNSVNNFDPAFFDKISEINYCYEDGIVLRMIPDGLRIVFGKSGEYEDKVKRLVYSLPAVYCDRERIQSVDLRFKDRVVLQYRQKG